ncbi:MAG: polysaccharide deacetylase family sporulation protein PdaB [Desulforudis sp.]|jgi:polysaccharide deacetylase family sporulation protein PdaB|nr:polysaccharide deacetylase family sporulation protein PdaB [Clostridia bacterium]MDQ7791409.1 polysaccharide deacetylase family sporulation protein PdaB [Clostridia bacterium]RJX16722.1 MAG: polysaccharide deacetylase family sporulation protein PdaB [Desulforudis sp.]
MRIYYLDLYRLRKGAVLLAMLVLALFILTVMFGREQVPTTAGTHSNIVYQVKTDEQVVALTFDISWGEKIPVAVADILKEEGIESTFFLSGPWIAKYPDMGKRLAGDGHEIASHGWRHKNYSEFTDEVIKEEIGKAHNAIKEVTGKAPKLIRTPNGDWNDRVVKAIASTGYRAIQWSVDSLDWQDPGVDAIANRVLERVHPGAIILMHASDSAEQTPEALPRVLAGLKEKGYKLVTVSELLEHGRGVAE